MRVLIVSLNTYSSHSNDGKLAELGARLKAVTAVAGDWPTLWGTQNQSRSAESYDVRVLPLRFARSNATAQLKGLRTVGAQVLPDVIHVETEPWQVVALQSLALARKLKVPVGIQFAENGPMLTGAGGALRSGVARQLLRRFDYAIGWSSGSTNVAKRLAPGIRTATFPGTGVAPAGDEAPATGRDYQRWYGPESDAVPKLAFVGRFSPEKGLDDFLAIADRLAIDCPIRVAIAGGEASSPTLSDWLRSRPWAYVHGVISRPDVRNLLRASDVLVAPSRTTSFAAEQFGKAPVEAMAQGTPVFAYDCGALKEVIDGGGHVVAEGSVTDLAAALEQYLSQPDSKKEDVAIRARVRASAFTDEALAESLIAIWSVVTTAAPPNE